MQIFTRLKNIIQNRPIYPTWEAMPDGLLLFFFISSSLPATYWGYVVKNLYPLYIDAFNEVGITTLGVVISVIMLILASQVFFFGCISKRCGELIYGRWFK